jgi:hypothetical protein
VGKIVSEALNALAERELDKILQGVRKFHPSGVESRYTGNREKPGRRSPTELPMLFEINPKPLAEESTQWFSAPFW